MFARGTTVAAIAIAVVVSAFSGALVAGGEQISISFPEVLRDAGIGAVSSISHPEILRDRTLRAVTSISYPDVLREAPAPSVTSIGFPEILRDAGLSPAVSTQVAEARESSLTTAVVSAFTLAGMLVGWILGRWTNGDRRRQFAPVGR